MPRSATSFSSGSCSPARDSSPVDKENIRRQVVDLVGTHDIPTEQEPKRPKPPVTSSSIHIRRTIIARARHNIAQVTPRATRFSGDVPQRASSFMPNTDPHDTFRNAINRSKSATIMSADVKGKRKIVRFRMDDHSIGKQKNPILTISDPPALDIRRPLTGKIDFGQSCEVRGSAISLRKEGLRGLVELKEVCSENEKRQNSLQASLKIFRRRIKFNQEKFIQPNETTTDDYVIHSARSPFCEVTNASPAPEDGQGVRPLSSDDHVRILKSALNSKHMGGSAVTRTTEHYDHVENYKNIKCSYRLPDNLNWGKEVSFKDIKDDSIPNVKTYVLEEDGNPHGKYKKSNVQNAVTLNTHNLNVHNSITQMNGKKVKVGDCEVSFDPRLIEWLEDSLSNSKMYRSGNFMTDETLECCSAPSVKRRVALKT